MKMLRAAVSVAVLACLVALATKMSWGRVLDAVRRADGGLLVLAAVLALTALVLQAARWYHVIQPVRRVPFRTVLSASLAGQAASCVLPLRAGEAVRLELLSRATGMSRAAALGTVATDHTVNGGMMLVLAAFAPLLLPVPAAARAAVWGGIVVVGVLAFALVKLASPADGAEPQGRIARTLFKLREGLLALRSPRALLGAASSSLLAWIVEMAAAVAALSAFGLQHGPAGGAAVIFGINLALAAPAAPANVGTFELGAAMALMALGEPSESAAAFALGYHVLMLLPMLLFGGAAVLKLRRAPALQPAVAT
jgi:uncharacterized protein (TIRG00374 family)